jgi:23S rRNA (pseudouridine1915-N3)-methyltransferase
MKLAIVAVGKLRDAGLRAVLDDYLGRIRRYAKCEEVEIRDGGPAEVAARIEKALPARSRVVALEVGGESWNSARFASFLAASERDAVGTLAWLVGGADGLPAQASARAHRKVSLSPLTLPHRLARVVLAEQLYRAFTTLRGEPYAH